MGKLHVRVIAARNLKAADASGSSDPYAIVAIGSQQRKTRKIKRSLNPNWDETFIFSGVYPSDQIKVLVYDWDRFSSDDPLGKATISLNTLRQGIEEINWHKLVGVRTGDIQIGLKAEDFGTGSNQNTSSPSYPTVPDSYSPPQPYGSQPGYPPQPYGAPGGYPPQPAPYGSGGYPPQQNPYGGYPPPSQPVPYGSGGYPPPQNPYGGYPPPQGGYPPPSQPVPYGSGGYPQQTPYGGYPPPNTGGYPPAQTYHQG